MHDDVAARSAPLPVHLDERGSIKVADAQHVQQAAALLVDIRHQLLAMEWQHKVAAVRARVLPARGAKAASVAVGASTQCDDDATDAAAAR